MFRNNKKHPFSKRATGGHQTPEAASFLCQLLIRNSEPEPLQIHLTEIPVFCFQADVFDYRI
jgi:hypothetical protein